MELTRESVRAQRDLLDLEWMLGVGITRFMRSTLGDMLARAELFGHDEHGRRITRNRDPWATMLVKRQSSEPSYTPDDRDLERFARASRRLLRVAEADHVAFVVLSHAYGNPGARWGKAASLFPLTDSGQKIVEAHRRKFPMLDMRPDEIVANDISVQLTQPNDIRRKRHERMRLEADALLVRAHAAWRSAGA